MIRNHYKKLSLFHFDNIIVHETYFELYVRENSIRNQVHKSCDIFFVTVSTKKIKYDPGNFL